MTRRSLPAVLRGATALGALVSTAAVGGCFDPRDDYQSFLDRPLVTRDAGAADVQLTPCQELIQQGWEGKYLVSCLPKAIPSPFALAVTQSITVSPDGAFYDLTFTPLKIDATNIADTVGAPTSFARVPLSGECTYNDKIDALTLPREATVLDRELVAEGVVLRGKLQSLDRACAELDGTVSLINLSLAMDGDICVFLRVPDDGALPTVSAEDYVCDPATLPPR